MMRKLCEVEIGAMAKIENILAKDILKERLLALGLTKGSFVEVLRKGPKDNLTVYKIRGAMIALRKEESSLINVN